MQVILWVIFWWFVEQQKQWCMILKVGDASTKTGRRILPTFSEIWPKKFNLKKCSLIHGHKMKILLFLVRLFRKIFSTFSSHFCPFSDFFSIFQIKLLPSQHSWRSFILWRRTQNWILRRIEAETNPKWSWNFTKSFRKHKFIFDDRRSHFRFFRMSRYQFENVKIDFTPKFDMFQKFSWKNLHSNSQIEVNRGSWKNLQSKNHSWMLDWKS